jgi:hypothetical protein
MKTQSTISVWNSGRLVCFSMLLLSVALGARRSECQQLTIQNGGKETVLNRTDLEAMPRIVVTTGDAATPVKFEGVDLRAALEKAGVTFGESLKGKRLGSCLLVEAADGYQVVFALPELDPAFAEKQVVLALLRNGKPLDEKEGPYRLVIPGEKRMARWVKQVATLKIVDVQ